MRRALCIWLPHWPLQRIIVARPELEGRAVVLHSPYRGGRRVAWCSARAAAQGIRPGMPLAEAAALLAGSALHQEPWDPAGDREALEDLAVWGRQFSPLVGLEDAPAPQGLLLDITGLEHLFGSEAALAAQVFRAVGERKLVPRVAVADTIGAAWAAAHFLPPSVPARAVILAPGQSLPALRPLPVEALRLPDEVCGLLHSLGIYRVGQLERLPRAELASRFGPQLAQRWDQAMGRLAEPIPAQAAPPELQARQSLEYPAAQRETVEAVLEPLIGRVAQMLVRCGRGAIRLDCRLACQQELSSSPQPIEISVGLFEPTASARHLWELVRMQLERLSLPGPVLSVEAAATATAPLQARQEELFGGQSLRQCARLLTATINRLASRLGRQAVLRARMVADAQPEAACHYEPLVERSRPGPAVPPRGPARSKAARPVPPGEKPCAVLPPRPLRLLRQPIALAAVTAIAEGPPQRFRSWGQEHRIARSWGPERIETGWWRGPMIARDYYRVETTTGCRFWLFRGLSDGRWYLHGTFE